MEKMEHKDKEGAIKAVHDAMSGLGDEWMVVIWNVKDGRVLLNRTTFQYPIDKFEESSELLQASLRREMDKSLPSDPLPEVDLDSSRPGPLQGA